MLPKKIIVILFFLLSSCNSPFKLENRLNNAKEIVKNSQFEAQNIKTEYFTLFSYQKITNPKNGILNIYFEGDGFAWRTRYQLSSNPTPINPMALKMALMDDSQNVVYLARPCQFFANDVNKECDDRELWSTARFSQKIINAENEAVEQIKKKYDFKKVNLFGFSGGGGVAVLVASKRNDVDSIITVAANLDHKSLTKIHQATPLYQSLNPIDFVKNIANIKQIHIAGANDNVVLDYVVKSFSDEVNKYSTKKSSQFVKIENASHEYEKWPEILTKYRNNLIKN